MKKSETRQVEAGAKALVRQRERMTPTARLLIERVATNVARLRRGAQLTLKGLAQRSEIHWRHVQKLEHGEANVTLRSLARLASALDVDPSQLLTSLHPVAAQTGPVVVTLPGIQVPRETMARLDAIRTRLAEELGVRRVSRATLRRALLAQAINAAERQQSLAGLLVGDPVRRGRPRGRPRSSAR